ncbi:hypothetical protein PhCBS80983_g00307 [Powellomyces hirtus]|uniref:Sodium/calcium exchanger membrane region domain-containing protein n=1 Tax=Powellomyces hirtus TaxID=109895 RepID=A0A507EFT0_9FUNG|nr:hypothetical protein PhCBS80983_g00307 [Powellomyces hirtus]
MHNGSQRGSRPITPLQTPQLNRHTVHGSALRSRAQLPRFNSEFRSGGEPTDRIEEEHSPDHEEVDLDITRQDTHSSGNDDDDHDGHESSPVTEDETPETDDGRTLRDVQEAINIKHPFGLRIWKPALYKKFRSIDTKSYKALHAVPGEQPATSLYLKPGNVLWCLLFGWWISLVYLFVAIFLLGPIALLGKVGATIWFCGSKREPVKLGFFTLIPWVLLELEHIWQYAKVLTNISGYLFWPFGKFIAKRRIYHMVFEQEREDGSATERTGLMADQDHLTSNYNDDTYVVGISDDEVATDSRPAPGDRIPKFAPHHDEPRDGDNASEVSEEAWHEYLLANRRYSYTSPHGSWSQWIPRWVRRTYNAGFGGNIFRLFVLVLIAPLHLLITCACSFMVFSLPMAKLNYVLLKHLLRHPLQISAHTPVYPKVSTGRPSRREALQSRASHMIRRTSQIFWRPASILSEASEPICIPTTLGTPTAMPSGAVAQGPQLAPEFQVILCTYDALGWEYYKYTYDGINIIFINLTVVIIFALVDFYFIGPKFGFHGIASPNVIFSASLISSIPLAYFIGMAVASITSETGSLAVGAVINATFGSIIEIILYMLALTEGKTKVVEGAVVGSLLAGLLALPGVSMFFGGIRRKEQRFNAKAAGVTATMLIMAVVGCFTPTLFQEVYGTQELKCMRCPTMNTSDEAHITPEALMFQCSGCRMTSTLPQDDEIYMNSTRYLVWVCAGALILMYAIGLLFTLRTHSKEIYAKPKPKQRRGRSRRARAKALFSQAINDGPFATGSSLAEGANACPPAQHPHERISGNARASITSPTYGTTRGKRVSRGVPQSAIETNLSEYPFPDSNLAERSPMISSSPRLRPSANPSAPISPSLPPRRSVHTTAGLITVQHPDPIVAVQAPEEWDSASDVSSDGDDESDGAGGHDHPNWGLVKSSIVLLGCTVLYSLVAEVLISSVDDVVEKMGIGEKVLGVTLFSWVPLVTEFYNAIAFAMNNNIALSLEIGSAYVMQAAMLQIPVIIFFSNWYFPIVPSPTQPSSQGVHIEQTGSPLQKLFNTILGGVPGSSGIPPSSLQLPETHHAASRGFTLIFPRWDLYAVFFGTFILTYVYIEGKANYFKGAMLLGAYAVLAGVYFFEPSYE